MTSSRLCVLCVAAAPLPTACYSTTKEPYRLAARLGRSAPPVITAVECLQLAYTLLQLTVETIKRGIVHGDICPPNVLVDVVAEERVGANALLAELAAMTRINFKVADFDIVGVTTTPQTVASCETLGRRVPAVRGHVWSRPMADDDQPTDGSKLFASDLFGVGSCVLYILAFFAVPGMTTTTVSRKLLAAAEPAESVR